MPYSQVYRQLDLSGGVQTKTSHKLRKRSEVESSKNAAFNIKIGSAVRRPGYEQVGETIQHGSDGLFGGVYRYYTNNKILAGVNDANGAYANLRYLDSGNWWTDIITDAPVNTRFQGINYLDEFYIAGKSPNEYMTLQNIDSTLTASSNRNVLSAPKCAYIAEYGGRLYAINCQINGTSYPDRAYQSSPALGAVTFVNTNQQGLLQQLRVDSVKYLKPNMVVDIYGAGTEAKKVDSLTIISVDKNNNRISFAPTQMTLEDNDEIWLEDRKNKLSILWNTDYPTPEDADYLRVPSGSDGDPSFMGWGKNGNRLILYTKDSVWKWDGGNLVNVSEEVGCTSHNSIATIGNWMLWLHTSGIWAYSVMSGQPPKLISRGFENYIDAITQSGFERASAVTVGRIYKVSVGELQELDSITTSTSTSSTSTSSTSTSTSSTSTSSTSTSSTSTSATTTSTSTSSTSTSTSSTSTSSTTTSISTSTSSTSTSTSTAETPKEVVRLVYDYDLNAFWPEYHRREIRYQFNHTMNGYRKPYFVDDTGRLFRDEIGNKDHFDTIPFEVTLGQNDFNNDLSKIYAGVVVDSESARTANASYSLDGGSFNGLGQLDDTSKEIKFPAHTNGRKIQYKFTHNDGGDAPAINGVSTFYSAEERTLG